MAPWREGCIASLGCFKENLKLDRDWLNGKDWGDFNADAGYEMRDISYPASRIPHRCLFDHLETYMHCSRCIDRLYLFEVDWVRTEVFKQPSSSCQQYRCDMNMQFVNQAGL